MSERERLKAPHPWRRWGPYLADRAWGTVREDYSADADAWKYFPHDLARSKAYRWGEDGIAGFCDRYQILCWSMAFWNERDPILKERFFGLVPTEGSHGEDVKECYFHLDALPSHAYQRLLYKYPQREFPYAQLIERNRGRSRADGEVELIDTGIFDDGRYFDIEIEIAKEDADAIVFRVTAHNRGPERAPIHLIPHLWFRNTWAWASPASSQSVRTPILRRVDGGILADDSDAEPLAGLLNTTRLGPHLLEIPDGARVLFTDNETHAERVYGSPSRSRYVKDAFHRAIVNGEHDAVNPENFGTKACAWMRYDVEPGDAATMTMRLAPVTARDPLPAAREPNSPGSGQRARGNTVIDERRKEADASAPLAARETNSSGSGQRATGSAVIEQRKKEATEFYETIHPKRATDEEKSIQRQAFAGMLWTKQSYLFDVDVWLDGDDPANPPPSSRNNGRNSRWRHLNSMRVLSMPDAWEYPWFAAWDLAFHSVVFALIDAEFAKEQLWLMLFEQFQHPNGQIPAYEWEFSDLNPPVQAWAVWRVYNMDRIRNGRGDREFLEKCFHKLLLNFTWWVNKVDSEGNNVFEGGFLGLDNITVIERSTDLPEGAVLEQSDATGWMGMFSLVMMRISLELARTNSVYEGLATKFFEHYVYIGAAMKMMRNNCTLWDEQDNFFYDLLRLPDGHDVPFRVRSLVGLIPLYAIERLEQKWIEPFPVFRENLDWFLQHRREIVERCVTTVHDADGSLTHVLAVVDQNQLQHLLARVVDPAEFLSPHGIRSLSKFHQEHPFRFGNASVGYEPAESIGWLKGGNSNWRGPVWFPTTFLFIESLRKLEKAFGGSVHVTVGDDLANAGNAATADGHLANAGDLANIDGEHTNADGDPPIANAPHDPLIDTRATEGLGAGSGALHDDIRARGKTLPGIAATPARTITLEGLAARIADRMIRIFVPDEDGYRPVFGPRGTRKSELFAHDPHWRNLVWFHEYFNGDHGEGLGASHQTGWTGLVASLIDEWRI